MDKISFINKVYFGDLGRDKFDKSTVNFLADDFQRCLKLLLQREIIVYLVKKTAKSFTNSKQLDNGGIALGNFDPLGYSYLQDLLRNINICLTVSIRQLIRPERKDKNIFFKGEVGSCTGGDFVKDLIHLNNDDYITYFDNTAKRFSFLNSSIKKDLTKFNTLVEKAKRFNSKNYSNIFISQLEGIGLHKDKMPLKRTMVHEETIFHGTSFKEIHRTYRDNLEIPLPKINSCLNELGELIKIYSSIFRLGCLTLPKHLEIPVGQYVDNFSMIFKTELSAEEKAKLVDSFKKKLGASFDVICWGF